MTYSPNSNIKSTTPQVVAATPGSALNAIVIPSTEVKGRWVSVQVLGTFSATLRFETSNNNKDRILCVLTRHDATAVSTTGSISTTATATGMWHGPAGGRYFRAYTSGTVDAVASPAGSLFSVVDTEFGSEMTGMRGPRRLRLVYWQ
jgi:hypothetical protein